MEDTGLITYETVTEILEKNDYHGFTVKRIKENRQAHTFVSIKWYAIDIVVDTLKLNGENIVVKITMDGNELEGIEDFERRMKDIGIIHRNKRKKEGL